MAVITADVENTVQGVVFINWLNITGADTAAPEAYGSFADKTVQAFGDFNGGTITMQGSNDTRVTTAPGDAIWETLTDNLGNDILFTGNDGALIAEAYRFIRPSPDSDIADVTVSVTANMS